MRLIVGRRRARDVELITFQAQIDHSRQDAQQRRLAGAVRADEDDFGVRGNDAVEAIDVQRRAGVVAEVQVLYRYHVLLVLVLARSRQ